uniref:R3H domain-containing protein n=1 Tax=Macrostomum lignano TaxID=282301 RepID=A0A1I8FNT8_9PLAT
AGLRSADRRIRRPARPPAVRAQLQQQLAAEAKAPVALEIGRRAVVYEKPAAEAALTCVQYQAGGAASLATSAHRQRRQSGSCCFRQREAEEAARAGRPGMIGVFETIRSSGPLTSSGAASDDDDEA